MFLGKTGKNDKLVSDHFLETNDNVCYTGKVKRKLLVQHLKDKMSSLPLND